MVVSNNLLSGKVSLPKKCSFYGNTGSESRGLDWRDQGCQGMLIQDNTTWVNRVLIFSFVYLEYVFRFLCKCTILRILILINYKKYPAIILCYVLFSACRQSTCYMCINIMDYVYVLIVLEVCCGFMRFLGLLTMKILERQNRTF